MPPAEQAQRRFEPTTDAPEPPESPAPEPATIVEPEVLPVVRQVKTATDHLAESMSQAVGFLERAGELLEQHVQRQQQLADSLRELPELLRRQNAQGQQFVEFVHQLDAAMGRNGQAVETLNESMHDLGRQLEGTQDNTERLAEGLEQLSGAVTELGSAQTHAQGDLLEQVRQQKQVHQEIRELLGTQARQMRTLVLAAIVLSAGAILAVIVAVVLFFLLR